MLDNILNELSPFIGFIIAGYIFVIVVSCMIKLINSLASDYTNSDDLDNVIECKNCGYSTSDSIKNCPYCQSKMR